MEVFEKGADDHNLSLRANGLDCLWMAKEIVIVWTERHGSLKKGGR